MNKSQIEGGSNMSTGKGGEGMKQEKRESLPVTGAYHSVEEWQRIFAQWMNGEPVQGYARYGYPELKQREAQVAQLVNAEPQRVKLYNSGMSAITSALESLSLSQGDTILYSLAVYGQSKVFIEGLQSRGVRCIPIDSGDIKAVQEAIRAHNPRAIFSETVGNAENMPVLDVQSLFRAVEEKNKGRKDKTADEAIGDNLQRQSWATKWLETQPADQRKAKFAELVQHFKVAQDKILQDRSVAALKGLVDYLKSEGIKMPDAHAALLELVRLIERSWHDQRLGPIKIILDNTIPTESGLDIAAEIKKTTAPVIVAESGTKFFAEDEATLGVIWTNSGETAKTLDIQRQINGSYLPQAAEAKLPVRTKEEWDRRNRNVIHNVKRLAEAFAKVVGHAGIISVSQPNLPTHPNFDYVQQHMPEGSSAVFYISCEDAWETAKKLEAAGLAGKVEWGGSFGFDKTRFAIFDPNGARMRVAGGDETAEEIEAMCRAIESI